MLNKENLISAKYLRSILWYDRRTGCFFKPTGGCAGAVRPNGYIGIYLLGRDFYAHRLAWLFVTGTWPLGQIDHRNGIKTDNRFENLRHATASQNSSNRRVGAESGLKGAYFHKGKKKWYSRIGLKHLGYFDTKEAAHAAWAKSAEALYGEFHRST